MMRAGDADFGVRDNAGIMVLEYRFGGPASYLQLDPATLKKVGDDYEVSGFHVSSGEVVDRKTPDKYFVFDGWNRFKQWAESVRSKKAFSVVESQMKLPRAITEKIKQNLGGRRRKRRTTRRRRVMNK